MAGLVLLTGATGYVGGRLLRRLEDCGRPVRCLARRPEFLKGRVGPGTEVVAGDLLDAASLEPALRGVHTAYYLVHSMGASGGFEEKDRTLVAWFTGDDHGRPVLIGKRVDSRGLRATPTVILHHDAGTGASGLWVGRAAGRTWAAWSASDGPHLVEIQ